MSQHVTHSAFNVPIQLSLCNASPKIIRVVGIRFVTNGGVWEIICPTVENSETTCVTHV